MDISQVLKTKEDRLEQLLRYRHYSRTAQHKVLIPLLTGFKETVSRLYALENHRGVELVSSPLPALSSPTIVGSLL